MKKLLVLTVCLLSASLLAQTTAKTTTAKTDTPGCKNFVYVNPDTKDAYNGTLCLYKADKNGACTKPTTTAGATATKAAPNKDIFTLIYEAFVDVWNAPSCESDKGSVYHGEYMK
jgi:hypothetical protein